MTFSGYRVAYFAQKCGAESASLLSLCTAGFPLPVKRAPSSQVQCLFHLWNRKKTRLVQPCWGTATAGINITGRDTITKECGPMKKKRKPFLSGTLHDLLVNIHLSSKMLSCGLHRKTVPFTSVRWPQWKLPVGLQLQKHLQATRGSWAILYLLC